MTLDETLQGFQPEEVPENVYDADKFPPRWQPGTKVRCVFRFEEDKPDRPAVSLNDDKTVVRVAFQGEATHLVTKDGEQPVPQTSSGNQPVVRFQNVDSRQGKTADGNVIPSSLHRLFRALVGRDGAKLVGTDPRLIIAKMRELDGKETFDALVGWRLFDSSSNTEYSTANKKSRSYEKRDGTTVYQEPWPFVDGQPAKTVNGEFPREFLQTFVEKKVTPAPVEVV